MSIKAVSWALEQRLPDAIAKLVLIGICDAHNNGTGRSFPSRAQLAIAASCDERTVTRKLKALEDDGWLTVIRRYDQNGRQTSNEYSLNFNRGEGDTLSTPLDTSVRGEGDTAVHPYEQEKGTGNTTLLSAQARTFNDLSKRLCEAAGITDETKTPGLMVLAEPLQWLDNGCDLEKDILPTLRSIAARGRQIGSWAYCSEAVFEARNRRLAPAPEPSQVKPVKRRESISEKIERLTKDGKIDAKV
jgi:hypothetical protein